MVSHRNSQDEMKVDTSGLGGWSFGVQEFVMGGGAAQSGCRAPPWVYSLTGFLTSGSGSHIKLRGIHAVTFRPASHSGGSGFSWPILTHGCCQKQGKVALFLGVRISMLAITFLFRISSWAYDNVL